MHKKWIFLLLILALPLQAEARDKFRLILDWFPNADHVPLYVARDGGFFEGKGLEIELLPPADPNDPLKLVAVGRAAFGINYQPNVIIARAEGLPVKSVGILVEHPLSSLAFLKSSGIRTPADLKGKRIGYSVQQLELALLKAIAGTAGLTLSRGPKHEWDVCAGAIIIQEAGGVATNVFGDRLRFNRPFPKTKGILAGAPKAFGRARDMVDAIGASDRMSEFDDTLIR